MDLQSTIDKFFDEWLVENSRFDNDIQMIDGYNKFRKELIYTLKTLKPSRFDEPNIKFQIDSLQWFTKKGQRPYVWNGELGLQFSQNIEKNKLPKKFHKLWNRNFNLINEYKEWCMIYNCEPKLRPLGKKDNLHHLEYRLANWADQIKKLNASNSLSPNKYKEINDEMSMWFDWNKISIP